MDRRKSVLNVVTSVLFKIAAVFLTIFVRRFLIRYCGNDINGLNSLYLSIIGFLSVADLGIGSAITFCMYKPIVEEDNAQVRALYQLFRRIYLVIGVMILAAGLAIAPFITVFAKDYAAIDVNFQLTFVLMLLSVVITYFFSAKISLINAYKNNYITTAINSGGIILQHLLQIVVLLLTKSYIAYLWCRILAALAQWGITEIVTRRKYAQILVNHHDKISEDTKGTLQRSVKAMFMHKIGYALVNTVDSVVISAFVGVVALGSYSNYYTISSSMMSILNLVFISLTSVIGHFYVKEDKAVVRKYCEAFHLMNYVIGLVFFLGYYAIVDDLVALLFDPELVVQKSISFVITANGFVQFLRQSTLTFREATGTFYNDRWKPLAEGVCNLVLSILFVNWIGVTGVIVATIITNLLICHIVEPFVLYKNAFLTSPRAYYLRNYALILLFVGALAVLHYSLQQTESHLIQLLVNGCVSVGISAAVCLIVFLVDKESVRYLLRLLKKGNVDESTD